MKKNYFILITALIFCGTSWGQTSYGGLQMGNSGTEGGTSNSFFGNLAGENNGTGPILPNEGVSNTFIGSNSGRENGFGAGNTFLGSSSGRNNTSGFRNTFLGHGAGFDNTNGDFNTYIGWWSGYSNQTGSGNVFLGYAAGSNETGSNLLHINNTGIGDPLIWGDFTDGSELLEVNGRMRIRFEDIISNNALNNVLVVDNFGNIHRRTAASIDTNTERTDEEIRDVAGAMVSGNTETRISVTYDDIGNEFDFVVEGDLSEYNNDAGFITSPDDADADPNNEIQSLSYDVALHSASISGGNSVDIAPFPSYPASAGDGGDITNSYFGHEAGLVNTGENNTFIGHSSGFNNTMGNYNIAIGRDALIENETGTENIAIGYDSGPSGNPGLINTIAIGSGSEVGANGAVAVGDGTSASGSNSTALGSDSGAIGANSLALGYDALAIGVNSTAIGNGALVAGENSIAIGYDASVMMPNRVRIGNFEAEDIAGVVTWTVVSDGRFKINIEEDVAGLDFIKSLRPVSYNLDRRKIRAFNGTTNATNSDVSKKIVGFIAQEVEQAVQENDYVFTGVKTPANEKDHYGLRYSEFVPSLTKAVQELSAINDNMQEQVEAQDAKIQVLEERLAKVENGNTNDEVSDDDALLGESDNTKAGFALYQNVPNPFDQTTSITTLVPERVTRAELVIYNLLGLELERYDIRERGQVSTVISGDRFPSGMYIYALLADDELIATKKMVLKK